MTTLEKTSLDLPSSDRSDTATTRSDRGTDTAKPPTPAQETAKCPKVGDPLGDFSEQTGSFFE
jgi:hypothetical protein